MFELIYSKKLLWGQLKNGIENSHVSLSNIRRFHRKSNSEIKIRKCPNQSGVIYTCTKLEVLCTENELVLHIRHCSVYFGRAFNSSKVKTHIKSTHMVINMVNTVFTFILKKIIQKVNCETV